MVGSADQPPGLLFARHIASRQRNAPPEASRGAPAAIILRGGAVDLFDNPADDRQLVVVDAVRLRRQVILAVAQRGVHGGAHSEAVRFVGRLPTAPRKVQTAVALTVVALLSVGAGVACHGGCPSYVMGAATESISSRPWLVKARTATRRPSY